MKAKMNLKDPHDPDAKEGKESLDSGAIFPLVEVASTGLWGHGNWDWQSDVEKAAKWLDTKMSEH